MLYYYTFYASDGANNLSTLLTGMTDPNTSVTVTYPQNLLVGNTLYHIPANGSSPLFKQTKLINSDYYEGSFVYSSHSDNILYYFEVEDVAGTTTYVL